MRFRATPVASPRRLVDCGVHGPWHQGTLSGRWASNPLPRCGRPMCPPSSPRPRGWRYARRPSRARTGDLLIESQVSFLLLQRPMEPARAPSVRTPGAWRASVAGGALASPTSRDSTGPSTVRSHQPRTWNWAESNRRPPVCRTGALPSELQPHLLIVRGPRVERGGLLVPGQAGFRLPHPGSRPGQTRRVPCAGRADVCHPLWNYQGSQPRTCPGVSTGGRSRTRNQRCWRPPLYLVELHPYGDWLAVQRKRRPFPVRVGGVGAGGAALRSPPGPHDRAVDTGVEGVPARGGRAGFAAQRVLLRLR